MTEKDALLLHPIGRVVHGRPWPPGDDPWPEQVAEIAIDAAWSEALAGLDEFSHIWIVWWPDRMPARSPSDPLRIHPEGREELPLVGVLATRTPCRPNPVAITAVRLIERRDNRLRVLGLDACEGTPILDIKPYLRRGDLVPEAATPGWLAALWAIHDDERSPD